MGLQHAPLSRGVRLGHPLLFIPVVIPVVVASRSRALLLRSHTRLQCAKKLVQKSMSRRGSRKQSGQEGRDADSLGHFGGALGGLLGLLDPQRFRPLCQLARGLRAHLGCRAAI